MLKILSAFVLICGLITSIYNFIKSIKNKRKFTIIETIKVFCLWILPIIYIKKQLLILKILSLILLILSLIGQIYLFINMLKGKITMPVYYIILGFSIIFPIIYITLN